MQNELKEGKVSCVVAVPERGDSDGLVHLFHFHIGVINVWFGRASLNLGLPDPAVFQTLLKMQVEGCNEELAVWSVGQRTHYEQSVPTFLFDFFVLKGQKGLSELILRDADNAPVNRKMLRCTSSQTQGHANLFQFSTSDSSLQVAFASIQMPSKFDLGDIRIPLVFEDGTNGDFCLLPETERPDGKGNVIFECFCRSVA